MAARRGETPVQLNRRLRGELDWIVLKAVEKDRTRRYESANGLAADLRRHLDNEPVTAVPPTLRYQFGRFARKHRVALATVAAFALVLLAGTFATAWQAVRATRLAAQERQASSEAQKHLALARLNAYASEMNVAQQALAENNLERILELLNRQRPKPGEQDDLRGFEWRYLWQLCQGNESDIFRDAPPGSFFECAVTFSPEGRFLAYSGGGRVVIRDAKSRQVVTNLPTYANTLAFSPGWSPAGCGPALGRPGEAVGHRHLDRVPVPALTHTIARGFCPGWALAGHGNRRHEPLSTLGHGDVGTGGILPANAVPRHVPPLRDCVLAGWKTAGHAVDAGHPERTGRAASLESADAGKARRSVSRGDAAGSLLRFCRMESTWSPVDGWDTCWSGIWSRIPRTSSSRSASTRRPLRRWPSRRVPGRLSPAARTSPSVCGMFQPASASPAGAAIGAKCGRWPCRRTAGTVASSSPDGTIRLWNGEPHDTGEVINDAGDVAGFTPDGRTVVIAPGEGQSLLAVGHRNQPRGHSDSAETPAGVCLHSTLCAHRQRAARGARPDRRPGGNGSRGPASGRRLERGHELHFRRRLSTRWHPACHG